MDDVEDTRGLKWYITCEMLMCVVGWVLMYPEIGFFYFHVCRLSFCLLWPGLAHRRQLQHGDFVNKTPRELTYSSLYSFLFSTLKKTSPITDMAPNELPEPLCVFRLLLALLSQSSSRDMSFWLCALYISNPAMPLHMFFPTS
jgi:hypothetical protein